MKYLFPFLLTMAAAVGGMIFSYHGLLDLRAFQKMVHEAEDRVSRLENENRLLNRRAELLKHPTKDILERTAREWEGRVRSDEIVFLER